MKMEGGKETKSLSLIMEICLTSHFHSSSPIAISPLPLWPYMSVGTNAQWTIWVHAQPLMQSKAVSSVQTFGRSRWEKKETQFVVCAGHKKKNIFSDIRHKWSCLATFGLDDRKWCNVCVTKQEQTQTDNRCTCTRTHTCTHTHTRQYCMQSDSFLDEKWEE